LFLENVLLGGGAGFLSAVLMTAFEAPFWSCWGMKGVVEWQVNQILVSRLTGERYDAGRRLREALAMHLLHGTIAGAFLAAFLSAFFLALQPSFWFIGLAFSLLLWSVVPFLFRGPLERMGGIQFTSRGMVVSLLSHVVYGVSLGLMLQALL
jgi:hypothetical protein